MHGTLSGRSSTGSQLEVSTSSPWAVLWEMVLAATSMRAAESIQNDGTSCARQWCILLVIGTLLCECMCGGMRGSAVLLN